MAKKGGGSSGPSYDPVATAQAQSQANKEAVRESAKVNQINEVGPFGTVTYTGGIGTPNRTRTVALDPAGQEQLDLQNQIGAGLLSLGVNPLLENVGTNVNEPFTFDGLTPISGAGDLAAQASGLENATFQRGYNLLQPEFDRQRENEHIRLANQGIPEGSEAYDDAMKRLEDSQGYQFENLALSSVGAGRQEQSRITALEQAIRQQQIGERLTERSQPINELAALIQGAPAIGLPNFAAPAQYTVAPPDVIGATAIGLQNQQQANANNSALWGAGIGAAGNIGAGLLRGGYF